MSKQDKESRPNKSAPAGEGTNLDRQYGRIGIPAVAAALPFVGKAKNKTAARDGNQSDGERRHSVLSV